MIFSKVKKYNSRFSASFPAISPDGILKDVFLHCRAQESEACHLFVMGPPRSGTTLARGMISAHSQITTSDRETFYFLRRRLSLFKSSDVEGYKGMLRSSSNKIELFDRIAEQFKERHEAIFFLEKTPEHSLVLGDLIKWYPHSKFIFLIRDGRDSYASSFSNHEFRGKVGDKYPHMWKDVAISYLAHAHHESVMQLKYENLVTHPERSIRSVMQFIGLPFEQQQLDPKYFSATSMSRESGHEMLSKKVSSKSVGSYRDRLTKEQVQHFENIAGKELGLLGYPI